MKKVKAHGAGEIKFISDESVGLEIRGLVIIAMDSQAQLYVGT